MTIDTREKKKLRSREYYNENKEYLNLKIPCGCGGRYSRVNRSTHRKSVKHVNWIECTGQ
jgi:hypothetical protein